MTTVVFALQQQAANAVPEEAAPSGDLLTPVGGLMFWTLITFVILFAILGKLVFPKITAAVEAREKALEDAIEGAKRDREEAARVLAEHQTAMEAARIQTGAIIFAALVEGAALFAIVISFLIQKKF